MMLLKGISFGAVSIHVVFGANIGTLPISSSCPRIVAGLDSQPEFECTASTDWVGDQFNDEQCRAAIQRLYNVEVTKHGNTEYEFLLPGAIPYTSNPVMRTPRKYTVGQSCFDPDGICVGADEDWSGKCTLAIVMLGFFPRGSLPGQDHFSPQIYADTDVASFQDLWLAADLIETCCLQPQHIPGWALVGEAFPCFLCSLRLLIINRGTCVSGCIRMDY